MEEIKSYQEIPVDLFSWAIKKYGGLVHGKSYDSRRHAILNLNLLIKNNSFLIERGDAGFCHPSYPFTDFSLFYFPRGGNKVKDSFENLFDFELKNNLVMNISSVRVSDKYKCYHPIYNLIYYFSNKKDSPKILKNLCMEIQEKANEMLDSGDYIVSDRYTSEMFREIIETKSKTNLDSKFMEFIEQNRSEDLNFEKWYKKYG